MVRVLAVNNYPTEERFQRLVDCLSVNGADVSALSWESCSTKTFSKYSGVALSGSPDMMSKPSVQEKFSAEIEAVRDSSVPILGVCFGHQLMAHAFGSAVVEDRQHVLDFVSTNVLTPEGLFSSMPAKLLLLESRHEVVASLPAGFQLLARSETTEVAAMQHKGRPLYGVQSHPERYTKENPDGRDVVGNFVRLLR
ncbi:MAG: gamma-glutamyl-gamma-aminobutyrate hydrolase family protein [archaeon]|nr:MAG: gamma-glutamyl-gamma-aminobutyrate hydrolase family protein [archaeon]